MTIDQAIYYYMVSLGFNIRYGSAEGEEFPYYVFNKITDTERPNSLCQEQGDSGQAAFIFEGYVGGQAQAAGADDALTYVQTLHDIVNKLKGVIGTAPNQFRIWNNVTSGVTTVQRSSETLLIWGAEFNTIIWWEIV
jgi:hypothetical protein